jgi:hypothetical protein
MAGITGPFTLAALLAGDAREDAPAVVPPAALEIGGATVAAIARAFLDAGADVLLIHERTSPAVSEEAPLATGQALEQLETTVNIARFYEALAVVVTGGLAGGNFARALAERSVDCVVCTESNQAEAVRAAPGKWGVALPVAAFAPGGDAHTRLGIDLQRVIRELSPAVVTTSGDLPAAANAKHLTELASIVMRQA